MFSSKALQFSQLLSLQGIQVPYLEFGQDLSLPLSSSEQDLYFLLQNGHGSIPEALRELDEVTDESIMREASTYFVITIVLAVVSIIFNFTVIPFVVPLINY